MKVITAVMGFGLYLFALEVSEQLAPRWVWVWYLALVFHFLLCLAALALSIIAAVRRRMKAGATGSRLGIPTVNPARSKEE